MNQVDLILWGVRALDRIFTPRHIREQRQAEAEKQNARKEFHHERKMVALKAAWNAVDDRSDHRPWIRALHNHALRECAAQDTGYVSIMASGPADRFCDVCAALDGEVDRVDQELENPRLPPDGCTCTPYGNDQTGFCLCLYQPAFEDEYHQQQN